MSVLGRCLLCAVLVVAGQSAAAQSRPRLATVWTARHPAANAAADQAIAVAETSALLAQLGLPPGATASSSEPVGDGGYLGTSQFSAAQRPELVDEAAWWILPGTPAQNLAYIREHLPAGATLYASTPSQSVSTSGFALLRWSVGTGEIAERWLNLKLAELPGSQSGLRVDAEVLWVRPRTAIPTGAHLLRVLTEPPGHSRPHKYREHTVASGKRIAAVGKRIAAVAKLINSLPVARPSLLVMSCPAEFGALRLVFYPRAGAAPLAVAVISVGGCGGVGLTVEGREQPALTGDGFRLLARIESDLRLTLTLGPTNELLRPTARPHEDGPPEGGP